MLRHTLSNGRRVRIVGEEIDGLWEPMRGLISYRSTLRGLALLDTLIHEVMHAELPELSEQKVGKTARSIARLVCQISRRANRKGGRRRA
jgi:hypothetical protein